jgi:hypothetical protein
MLGMYVYHVYQYSIKNIHNSNAELTDLQLLDNHHPAQPILVTTILAPKSLTNECTSLRAPALSETLVERNLPSGQNSHALTMVHL